MASKPRPSPCFLDQMLPLKAVGGQKRWRSPDGKRLYTWDSRHGEIEVYDKRGRHWAVVHAITGKPIKPAKKGRRINV